MGPSAPSRYVRLELELFRQLGHHLLQHRRRDVVNVRAAARRRDAVDKADVGKVVLRRERYAYLPALSQLRHRRRHRQLSPRD